MSSSMNTTKLSFDVPSSPHLRRQMIQTAFRTKISTAIMLELADRGEVYESDMHKRLGISHPSLIHNFQGLVKGGLIEENWKKLNRGIWVKYYSPTSTAKWIFQILGQ